MHKNVMFKWVQDWLVNMTTQNYIPRDVSVSDSSKQLLEMSKITVFESTLVAYRGKKRYWTPLIRNTFNLLQHLSDYPSVTYML